jgi:hypothetical protein
MYFALDVLSLKTDTRYKIYYNLILDGPFIVIRAPFLLMVLQGHHLTTRIER